MSKATASTKAKTKSSAKRRAEATFCLEQMITATLDEYRTLLAKPSAGLQSAQVTRSA